MRVELRHQSRKRRAIASVVVRLGQPQALLAATLLLTVGCSDPDGSYENVGSQQFALALTFTSSSTNALASAAIPTNNVTNGTGPYTCSITTNTSGGASCSVSGGVVSYTAGSYAGYYLKSQRSGDHLQLVTAAGGPYLETGGAIGSTAELFKFSPSGSGFTFQAKSTSKYVRSAGTVSTGNDLVADSNTPDVYTMQDCNGTGDPGLYNRFGFASATGTNPYWKANSLPYVDAVNAGNGSACSPTSSTAWEGFYLVSNTDTLTITDSLSNTGTITVTVESPIAFMPSSATVSSSSAIPSIQTYGGSGIFTGGSSACTVTTNASGGGSCTVTGSGVVSYTAGAGTGSDVIRITDSQGHTGTFNVLVTAPFVLSASTSYALPSSALGTSVTASGGTTPYSCSVSTSSSGGSSCSVVGGVVTYTAGSTVGFNIMTRRTSDYLQLVTASGLPYVETGAALGSSAELWKIFNLGSGYTFQANSTGLYMRNGGTAPPVAPPATT